MKKPTDKGNLTDFDAVVMKGKKGNYDTNYNVQVACTKNRYITYVGVSTAHNDKKELQDVVQGISDNTAQKIEKLLADAGYASYINYEYLIKKGIIAYIPDQNMQVDFSDKPYHKEHFIYNEEKNQYVCPQGKVLKFTRKKKDGANQFNIYTAQQADCANCPVAHFCRKSKESPRTIHREIREALKEQMRKRLQSEEGKAIYKCRLHPIESIFGHFKQNLNYYYFLVRGKVKVQAEMTLMAIAHKLKQLGKSKGCVMLV